MNRFESSSHWLEAEYLSRRNKNPAYSLRAFAKLLDLPSGRVSQLISRKRPFTPKLGRKIADRLGFDPRKTEQLLSLVERERAPKKKQEIPQAPSKTYRQLNMDLFQNIADPLHFSLLSLAETANFQGEPRAIARRLGISMVEARAALERLVRLELMRVAKDGSYELAQEPGLATSQDVPSAALRQAHKRVLQDVIELIDLVDVAERDVTSISMAVDPARLPRAKTMIREFRRGLSEYLEAGNRTEVFRLNIQLVPVTKKEKR